MSAWLTRALALEDAHPCSESSVSPDRSGTRRAEAPNGAIGANGTPPPVFEKRAGLEGGEISALLTAASQPAIPAPYRAAFADLCAGCPVGVPETRWQRAVADAERFLTEWGSTAERLGWSANDLFGLHPTVPLSRVDHMGLCWLLKGQRVVLLTATEARFEQGLTYRRTQVRHVQR